MNNGIDRKAAILAAFLFLLAADGPPAAASTNISPVRLHLGPEQPRDVITVSNGEDTPKSYQVEVVAWSQTREDREVYTPTENVLAVPPLFTLEPGEKQLIRIGMLAPADPDVERAYRVFITELAAPQDGASRGGSIEMRLQIGVPLFVSPASPAAAALEVVGVGTDTDHGLLHLRNTGNAHVKVVEVMHRAQSDAEPVSTRAVVYLLAGQTAEVPFGLTDGQHAGTVTILTEDGGTLTHEFAPSH